MSRAKLYGADYSVYVRIARLALTEKGVDHELVPVDVFSSDGLPAWYLSLNPFGRIPAFEHDGLILYETAAITRYIDEAFAGPSLQPGDPRTRATMNQIVGLLDSYAYRTLVWDIYVERVSRPREGKPSDEDRTAAALPRAKACLAALASLKQPGPHLLGQQLTLADLHAAPIFAYFIKADEGRRMLADFPDLATWWHAMSKRSSVMLIESRE